MMQFLSKLSLNSKKSPKHNHLINYHKQFTANQGRVDIDPDQENMINTNAAETPLTLSQKVRDYSSIHFATPSFTFYPKFKNQIVDETPKPIYLLAKKPQKSINYFKASWV